MKYFASNIHYIRKANQLTQKEMAAKLGKSATAVASWEQGVRTPIVKDALNICRVFGVELDDLMNADLSQTYVPSNVNMYEFMGLYQKLNSTQQKIVYDLMKSMVNQDANI